MRNLLLFLAKYGHFLLFLFFEIICFFLIVNFNSSQKDIWSHSLSLYTGNVKERISNANNYLKLQEVNDSLHLENSVLLQEIINYKVYNKDNQYQNFEQADSLPYRLIPSRICDKTLHLRNNYFTLCKGQNHGIKKGMGVISKNGIVGIIKSVSDNYSDVILILNTQSRISVSIKNKNYFGNLVWRNNTFNKLNLEAIPKYAEISIGDTIVTSGYSTSFPPDIQVGKISAFEASPGGGDYIIDVELFNNIETISHSFVIDLQSNQEIDTLYSSDIKDQQL